ncbi:CHASE2 domain-containing protein [Chloroflexota bacterium]
MEFSLVFIMLFNSGWLSTSQIRTTDLLFKVADGNQEMKLDDSIVMVTIDDRSLEQLGHISSWPRTYYALAIDILAETQARIIVFDIVFAESSDGDNVILPVAYRTLLPNSESTIQN